MWETHGTLDHDPSRHFLNEENLAMPNASQEEAAEEGIEGK
jgi:hypothetical protein